MATIYRITDIAPPAELSIGEVVWADLRNGCENVLARGKARPFILLGHRGSLWQGMGITTKRCYAGGVPRTEVPDPRAIGLSGQRYLWGRTSWIAQIDLTDHIGWANPSLAETLISLIELPAHEAEELRDSARRHHRSAKGLHRVGA